MAVPVAPIKPSAVLPISWVGRSSPFLPSGVAMAAAPGRSAIAASSSRPWQKPRPTPPRHSPPSVLVIAFPGGPGTASLVQQARRCSSRSPVPVVVMEVPPPFSPEPLAA